MSFQGSLNLKDFRKLAKQAYQEKKDEEKKRKSRAERRKQSGAKKAQDVKPKRVTRLALKETVEGKRHVIPETRHSMKDILGVIKCSSCNTTKYKDEFERHRRVCKTCRFTRTEQDTLEKYSNHIVKLASRRSGCKDDDFGFTITSDWVVHRFHELMGCCELCGDRMTHSRPTKDDEKELFRGVSTNISLDQIVPANGYTPENVQLVHKRCNLMKLDMSVEDFISTCSKVAQKHAS